MDIFIDSGAWIAMLVAADRNHARARSFFDGRDRTARWVTTSMVIAESATWLSYHGYRSAALRLRLRTDAAESLGRLKVTWPTRDDYHRAWDFFERYADHRLSFVDCVSFAVCSEEKPGLVFTFDSDFAKAGFATAP